MAEYKRQVTFAAVAAIVIVLALASAVMYLPLGLGQTSTTQGSPGPASTLSSTETTTSFVTSLTSTTIYSTTNLQTCNINQTGCGTTTTVKQNWNYQDLAFAVFNSTEVKPRITSAYYYTILADGAVSPGNGTQLFANVFVIGAQTVKGNWTTGYTVTYTGRQFLNVTIQFTNPSTYNITGTTTSSLADKSSQISFDATQRQAIGVALANSTVTADIGGMAYYVYFAAPLNNGTVSGYWLQVNQVNGYRSLGILVNSALTGVLSVITFTNAPYLRP